MQNQLLEDTLYTTGKFLDCGFEYPLEREILLADYDPSVFKIIRTHAEHTVTQKYINGSKLIIEGFFRISVYYQPPSGANLTVISKKIPFRKQFELPDTVETPYFVTVSGETQYVNTRAVNPTRIDTRGIYRFSVRVYGQQRYPVATAVNSSNVCTDSEELSHFCLCGQGIRQFSLEDEISVGRELEKILNISSKNSSMNITVYRDKVNIKGEITAEIVYTLADSPQLHHRTKNFIYSQIVDVPGIIENNAAYAQLNVLSFTVTQNPQTNRINCMVSARIEAKVFRKMNLIAVTDVFSKVYEYKKELRQLTYDSNIQTVHKNTGVSMEDKIGTGFEPAYCFADVSAPEISVVDGVSAIKVKLTASAVVKNSRGEYECFTKTEDVVINTGAETIAENEYMLTAEVSDCVMNISGDTLKIKADVTVSGFEIFRKRINIVKYFEEDTGKPAEKMPGTLVLYYGKKGERLFDISRRYRADLTQIVEENSLEEKILTEDRMLLIPIYGM